MPITIERKKWILYRHISDFDIIKAVALIIKDTCKADINAAERYIILEKLAERGQFTGRNNQDMPLDSANHRINTLEYWMLGYEERTSNGKRFMFSPLGNLFLKCISEPSKLSKIFIAMMFALQFQHPGSKTDVAFQLYPFRLIFKLLTDQRLGFKLYNIEVECLIVFVETVDRGSYEELICKILDLRKKNEEEWAKILKSDEHTYVNSVYEWETYTVKLLSTIGILVYYPGDVICELYHPQKTNSKSKPTGRKATKGYMQLNPTVKKFVEIMLEKYTYYQKPTLLNLGTFFHIDIVKEIYSFYPEELLKEIGESIDYTQNRVLQLPKLIEEYSNNPNNETAYMFEDVLEEGFNLFRNVEAKKIGGAGHTDLECMYLTRPMRKFAVDAKSTTNKLVCLNANRLQGHREEIGAEYTIVVAPRYVPAVLRDIKGSSIVIILANTFAEYLYNHIYAGIRNIDYRDIDSIVLNHKGEDISKLVSDITIDRFAAR